MNKKTLKNMIVYTLLILGLVVVLYPFFYMVMNSFKDGPEIIHNPTAMPKSINFDGYIILFQNLNMARLFFNSIFIASSVTILNVLFSSMVAYGVMKTGIRRKDRIVSFILGTR